MTVRSAATTQRIRDSVVRHRNGTNAKWMRLSLAAQAADLYDEVLTTYARQGPQSLAFMDALLRLGEAIERFALNERSPK